MTLKSSYKLDVRVGVGAKPPPFDIRTRSDHRENPVGRRRTWFEFAKCESKRKIKIFAIAAPGPPRGTGAVRLLIIFSTLRNKNVPGVTVHHNKPVFYGGVNSPQ